MTWTWVVSCAKFCMSWKPGKPSGEMWQFWDLGPHKKCFSMGFSGTPNNNGTPENGKLDPYYSHLESPLDVCPRILLRKIGPPWQCAAMSIPPPKSHQSPSEMRITQPSELTSARFFGWQSEVRVESIFWGGWIVYRGGLIGWPINQRVWNLCLNSALRGSAVARQQRNSVIFPCAVTRLRGSVLAG